MHFWVGRGSPGPDGIRIADETGGDAGLAKADKKTLVLNLPGDLTIFDIDYFGVYSRSYNIDYGHVRIQPGLNVPPSLRMLGISPQVSPLFTWRLSDTNIFVTTKCIVLLCPLAKFYPLHFTYSHLHTFLQKKPRAELETFPSTCSFFVFQNKFQVRSHIYTYKSIVKSHRVKEVMQTASSFQIYTLQVGRAAWKVAGRFKDADMLSFR